LQLKSKSTVQWWLVTKMFGGAT